MKRFDVFGRYLVAGTFAFLVDLGLTLALSLLVHYLVANSIAFVAANAMQFFIVHRWVFGRPFERGRILPLYVATLAISSFGLLASNVLVYLGVDVLGLALAPVKAVTAIVVLGLNYGLRARSIYRVR